MFATCLLVSHNCSVAGNASLSSSLISTELNECSADWFKHNLSGTNGTKNTCSSSLHLDFGFTRCGDYFSVDCVYRTNDRVRSLRGVCVPEGFNQVCSVNRFDAKNNILGSDMQQARGDVYPHFSFGCCYVENRCCPHDCQRNTNKKWLVIEDLNICDGVKKVSFSDVDHLFSGGIVLKFSEKYPTCSLHINGLSLNNIAGLRVDSKKNFALSIGKILDCSLYKGLTEISSVFPITLSAPGVDGTVVVFEGVGLPLRNRIVISKLVNGMFVCRFRQFLMNIDLS